jgi:hypothetical protein
VHLLFMIERHLREHGIPASRFGRDAMGDPGFVASLRRGREPRESTVRRITAYLTAAAKPAGTDR